MFPIVFLAEIVIGFFVELLGYGIARVIIPLITLGRVKIDPVSSSSENYNWLGYRKDAKHIILGPTAAGVLGILIFTVAVALALVSIIEPQ